MKGLVRLVALQFAFFEQKRCRRSLVNWWTWSGSNRRPLPCHGSALPTAPQAHKGWLFLFSPSKRQSSNRKGGTARPATTVFPVLYGTICENLRLSYGN